MRKIACSVRRLDIGPPVGEIPNVVGSKFDPTTFGISARFSWQAMEYEL